jgi:hypothetical protein
LQGSLTKYSNNFYENAKKFNKDNTKLNISTFNDHFDSDDEDISIEEENMKKIAFAVAAFLNPETFEKNKFLIPTFSSIVTSTSINNLPDGGSMNYLASKDSSLLSKIMNLQMLEKSKNSKTSITEFSKYLAKIGATVKDYNQWGTSGSELDFEVWFKKQKDSSN